MLSTEPMNENNENNFFECDDRCVLGRLCLFLSLPLPLPLFGGFLSFITYRGYTSSLHSLFLFGGVGVSPPPLGPRVLWICVCGLASAAQAWGVLLRHVCLPVLWYFFCHASEPYGGFFYAACTKKHSRHIFSTGMGGKSQVLVAKL